MVETVTRQFYRPSMKSVLIFLVLISLTGAAILTAIIDFRTEVAEKTPADEPKEPAKTDEDMAGCGGGGGFQQFRPHTIREELTYEFKKLWTLETPDQKSPETTFRFAGEDNFLVADPETIRCRSGVDATQLWGMKTDVPLVPNSLAVVGNRVVLGRMDGLVAIRPFDLDGTPVSWLGTSQPVHSVQALNNTPWAAVVYLPSMKGQTLVLEILDVYDGPSLVIRLKGSRKWDGRNRRHVPDIVWDPANERIATTLTSNEISVFNISTGQRIGQIRNPDTRPSVRSAGIFSENRLAVMRGPALSVIQLDSGQELFSKDPVDKAGMLPGGDSLGLSYQDTNGDGVFDILAGHPLQHITVLRVPMIRASHIASEKGIVAALDNQNRIFVQSLLLAAEWGDVFSFPEDSAPDLYDTIVVNPIGTRIALYRQKQISIIDLEACTEIARMSLPPIPPMNSAPEIMFNRSGSLIRIHQTIYRIAKKTGTASGTLSQ